MLFSLYKFIKISLLFRVIIVGLKLKLNIKGLLNKALAPAWIQGGAPDY